MKYDLRFKNHKSYILNLKSRPEIISLIFDVMENDTQQKSNIGRSILWFVVIAVIVAGGFAISRQKETEAIKIGAILPLTGTAAYYGDQAKKGIEIALEDLKADYPHTLFEVIYEDSLYTAKGGIAAYQVLKNRDSVGAVLTGASQVSLAVKPLAAEDRILQMAIFSSASSYTSPDDLSFRISTRNEIEIAAIALRLKQKGYPRIGIIYINNDYGVGIKDSLKSALQGRGVINEVVSEEGFLLDANDFRTILLKMKTRRPSVIFVVGTAPHLLNILKQAQELKVAVPFISTRATEDPVLLQVDPVITNGLEYSYPFDSVSISGKLFSEKFRNRFSSVADAYAAEGYEGIKLLVGQLVVCSKDILCAQQKLTNLRNYDSVFGPLSFDINGDVFYPFFIKAVKDGQFVLVSETATTTQTLPQ